jgi:predicted ATP-grasp superfamily ATP-dependent carboligase
MAFLIGPKQTLGLAPCWQLISHKGTLAYEGGTCPIHPDYAERVARIATPAVRSVPGLAGYVGVDVILGEAANGSEDVVIEINPRVTTSYLGLSALCIHNLASVWLSLHVGNEVPPLLWHEGVVAYFPNGTIRKLENFSSSTEGSLPKM